MHASCILFHLESLGAENHENVRRLPGPPVYTPFWGDGKPPWLGGPKAHSPHDMFIHAGFESHHFLFFSGSHGNGTSPHHPIDTCTHDIRYTCPGSSSGLMTFNGGDGVPWPCHQPWYIYCHFLPIASMITFGLHAWAAISGAICHYLGCVSSRSISYCITFCFTMKKQEMMIADYGSWC